MMGTVRGRGVCRACEERKAATIPRGGPRASAERAEDEDGSLGLEARGDGREAEAQAEGVREVSLGTLVALLVLIVAVVLLVIGRMDGLEAGMFAALALAVLLTAVPFPWRVSA